MRDQIYFIAPKSLPANLDPLKEVYSAKPRWASLIRLKLIPDHFLKTFIRTLVLWTA